MAADFSVISPIMSSSLEETRSLIPIKDKNVLYPTEGIEFIRYLKIPLPFSDILRINIYRAIMKLPYQIFLLKFQKGLDTYEF